MGAKLESKNCEHVWSWFWVLSCSWKAQKVKSSRKIKTEISKSESVIDFVPRRNGQICFRKCHVSPKREHCCHLSNLIFCHKKVLKSRSENSCQITTWSFVSTNPPKFFSQISSKSTFVATFQIYVIRRKISSNRLPVCNFLDLILEPDLHWNGNLLKNDKIQIMTGHSLARFFFLSQSVSESEIQLP